MEASPNFVTIEEKAGEGETAPRPTMHDRPIAAAWAGAGEGQAGRQAGRGGGGAGGQRWVGMDACCSSRDVNSSRVHLSSRSKPDHACPCSCATPESLHPLTGGQCAAHGVCIDLLRGEGSLGLGLLLAGGRHRHRQGGRRPPHLAALQHQRAPAANRQGGEHTRGCRCRLSSGGDAARAEPARSGHNTVCNQPKLRSQHARPLPHPSTATDAHLTAPSEWSMTNCSLWPLKGPMLSRNCRESRGEGAVWCGGADRQVDRQAGRRGCAELGSQQPAASGQQSDLRSQRPSAKLHSCNPAPIPTPSRHPNPHPPTFEMLFE